MVLYLTKTFPSSMQKILVIMQSVLIVVLVILIPASLSLHSDDLDSHCYGGNHVNHMKGSTLNREPWDLG
jgi:hypothetical protein